jgi:hypothetical protein
MARPTDYTPEIAAKVVEFIAACAETNRLLTIEGLSTYIGVARSTLYLWAQKDPEFSDILDGIMARQGDELIQKGLKGEYNPTITKLMLSKHGYRESSDITTDGKALPTPILGGATKDD